MAVKKAGRKRAVPYKGELGKRGRLHQLWLVREIRNYGEDQDGVKEADEEIDLFEKRMLLLLLEHYEIPLDRPDKWMLLALSLARDRVPAFSAEPASKRGRPRKSRNALYYGLGQMPPRKPRGRPQAWTSERNENIQVTYEKGAESLRAQGRRVTNIAAFVEYGRLLRNAGKLQGWKQSEIRAVAEYLADRYRKIQAEQAKEKVKKLRHK